MDIWIFKAIDIISSFPDIVIQFRIKKGGSMGQHGPRQGTEPAEGLSRSW